MASASLQKGLDTARGSSTAAGEMRWPTRLPTECVQATAAAGDRQTIGGAAVVARSERSVLRSALKWAVLLLFLRLAWLLAGRRPELRNLLSRLPRMPKLRLPGLRRGGGGAS